MKTIVNHYFNEFIESKKLPLRAFAESVGVERQTISKWIHGTIPNMSTLDKVKEVYPDFSIEAFHESVSKGKYNADLNSESNMPEPVRRMLVIADRFDQMLDKVMSELTTCNIDKGRLMQKNEYLKEQLKSK